MQKNILIPIDLDRPNFADQAIKLGMKEEGAHLHFVSIIPCDSTPFVGVSMRQTVLEKANKEAIDALASFVDQRLHNGFDASFWVLKGVPADRILSQARQVSADLMILAANNRSRSPKSRLGSTASQLVKQAQCSLIVLRGDGFCT